jgi:hypothetical protein
MDDAVVERIAATLYEDENNGKSWVKLVWRERMWRGFDAWSLGKRDWETVSHFRKRAREMIQLVDEARAAIQTG